VPLWVLPLLLLASLLAEPLLRFFAPTWLARLVVFRAGEHRYVRLRARAIPGGASAYRESAVSYVAPALADVVEKLDLASARVVAYSTTDARTGFVLLENTDHHWYLKKTGRYFVRIDVKHRDEHIELVPRALSTDAFRVTMLVIVLAAMTTRTGVPLLVPMLMAVFPILVARGIFRRHADACEMGKAAMEGLSRSIQALDELPVPPTRIDAPVGYRVDEGAAEADAEVEAQEEADAELHASATRSRGSKS
jgi:hypothetical protein